MFVRGLSIGHVTYPGVAGLVLSGRGIPNISIVSAITSVKVATSQARSDSATCIRVAAAAASSGAVCATPTSRAHHGPPPSRDAHHAEAGEPR